MNVNIDGTFPEVQMYWTNSTSCTGTPYFNDGRGGSGGVPTYYHTVVWSGAADTFYLVSGSATKNLITSPSHAAGLPSSEGASQAAYDPAPDGSYTCMEAYAPGGNVGYSGWNLSTFNASSTLGWNLTTCSVPYTFEVPSLYAVNTTYTTTTVSRSCLNGPLQLP
jgi:hypothetical protein